MQTRKPQIDLHMRFGFALPMLFLAASVSVNTTFGQVTGSFVVKGSTSTFYPVTFVDGGFPSNVATVLQIGRSSVHMDSTWRGSMIAQFRFHTNNWGNGADFINADIREHENGNVVIPNFVGGWQDVTYGNSTSTIVIWLKGGTTTYYYQSNYAVTPAVYDGVQNALPYNITNGGTCNTKSVADSYVDANGTNMGGSLFVPSTIGIIGGNSYNQLDVSSDLNSNYQFVAGGSATGTPWAGKMVINYSNYKGNNPRLTIDSTGNVGIGTQFPQSLLAVAGTVTAKGVTVTQNGWSDFVFDPGYRVPSLDSVSAYISQNHHLPGIPSKSELDARGLDLGTMQKLQMQKIEELTLFAIEARKRDEANKALIETQQALLEQMQTRLAVLQAKVDSLVSHH